MLNLSENNIDLKAIKNIAKTYNPLDYKSKLIDLLLFAYPNQSFEKWEKYRLHKLLNETIINNYRGEQVLKSHLFKNFLEKEVVAAFEIKVNNSRVDFLTINGHTNSFEIKSDLDNLTKLKKQASDYVLAFEYNYLVIDEKHLANALDIVPNTFGLWSFSKGKKRIHRKASLNKKLDPYIQLTLLTKKELQKSFSEVQGASEDIVKQFSATEINKRFKKILKNRYSAKWSFLLDNHPNILPIDLQFFFKTNVNPSYIYHH